jgi:response regulator RpfG family c-di-GMP phosphodiesterase
MPAAVLFVDDEPHLLDGIARSLRAHFDIRTASSAAMGLQIVKGSGPFAVVVSDMRMPEMNGAQFLSQVREYAPDTVRIILSGQADLQQTIAAVNEGNIFRFLSKPCDTHTLLAAVGMGVEQHRLITAEKVLLEQTLTGAVNVLVEILGVVTPSAYSHARRLRQYVVALAAALDLGENWQWPLAASLSQIGCMSLPKDTVGRSDAGQALTQDERRLFESHPRMAAKMLEAIPRLETVTAIVASQNTPLTDEEILRKPKELEAKSAGCMLLYAAVQFDRQVMAGCTASGAVEALRVAKVKLPLAALEALRSLEIAGREHALRSARLIDLAVGMLLDEPLMTRKGVCLVPAGQEVTAALLARLRGIDTDIQVQEPIRVQIPC